ncbi:MAG: hypothetical protein A2498_13650 [Lentisphaerae bacterium RIFOXYC12_FULL_60_16]|nr:MAG: hypothetical protein A2498_13650 [Lentisphaerae bacterium RIFOXYC12_FULL_60_16]
MKYNLEKVDELTMALMFLVMWDRREDCGARAWKSFDWATMDRLHEKGWITDPKKKAKSVGVTEDGYKQAEAAFLKHFGAPKVSGKHSG